VRIGGIHASDRYDAARQHQVVVGSYRTGKLRVRLRLSIGPSDYATAGRVRLGRTERHCLGFHASQTHHEN
ncbi:MAG: hypothetical protein ACREQ3_25230, partial [Candidatus Binatia bacterium]